MLLSFVTLAIAVSGAVATDNRTLADICSASYSKGKLPLNAIEGITVDPSSVSAQAFYNVSVSGQVMYPDATFDYCNVTFAYSHNGWDDRVLVTYWLPTPSEFQSRFLGTGGGGYAINSGSQSVAGGIIYGAVAGLTDGGFGGFDQNWDSVFPLSNGTANLQSVYMFGYQAIHEMTVIGQAFTKNVFGMSNDEKLYTYYQGCSEGGREGWSQVQRYTDIDGAVIGAPAIRYAFQQVQHLFSNIVEQTNNYYPPPCELSEIVNKTIAICDPLDGKIDGVVARTDLCELEFNISTLIGTPYYCAAAPATTGFVATSATPVQNGTITAEGIKVAQLILNGLKDSQGRQVYFSYQPSATFTDAQTQYNFASKKWELDQSGLGAEWVERFLLLQNASLLPTLEGVTYDTLKMWIIESLHTYAGTLETTWPDLTPFHNAGGKVIHYHGESDFSIPTDSSVRYHESVRQIMYPGLSYNESNAKLNQWYKLFLVPGAAHCDPNPLQPNGPFPQTNLQVMINWVEKGVEPQMLNATILQGEHIGENAQICQWPLRPLWDKSGKMECVYNQASIDTWHHDLDGIPLPVY